MQYTGLFESAVRMTEELGLKLVMPKQFFCSEEISSEKLHAMVSAFVPFFKSNGYFSSKDLNKNCVQVHIAAQNLFKEMFGIDSYLTIGSMHGDGFDYCAISYEEIKSEIKKPNLAQELRAHIWLTLSDGSIFDWTGLAWYLENCGITAPLEECAMHIPLNTTMKELRYKPFLIGKDYLVVTGTIRDY
ncbi:hypothetical protein [Rheinheimera sp. 4Y26]|uniref:hypothetical protein n=1 Tax=Rheinheimera sp. 4Y26 TaxID=2977811 RepID=UPI0021B0BEE6|nr:hypothetical protein [Rheinheimera sp. 4Y26]MCT6698366.1 hypothetical protein [Rheinheimera sp. 4Y26]